MTNQAKRRTGALLAVLVVLGMVLLAAPVLVPVVRWATGLL